MMAYYLKISLFFGVILFKIISLSYAFENAKDEHSIVCLETELKNSKPKLGVGFFISPTAIATVSHQVSEPQTAITKITVYFYDKRAPIVIKDTVIIHDDGVAIINFPKGMQSSYLYLDPKGDVAIGAPVTAVGCQTSHKQIVREGKIDGKEKRILSGQNEAVDIIALNVPVQMGFSGSPLITGTGEVTGILYGYDEKSKTSSYAFPNESLFNIILNNNNPEFGKIFYYQGIPAYYRKQFDDAKKYFLRATEQEPNNPGAFKILGMTLFKLNQFAEARDALLEAVLLNPDDPSVFYNLGLVYKAGLSDKLSARNAFRRYLQLDSSSADAIQVKHLIEEIKYSLQ